MIETCWPLQTIFSALAVEPEVVSSESEDDEPMGAAGGRGGYGRRDTSADALQRLLFDVFKGDVRAFRCRPASFELAYELEGYSGFAADWMGLTSLRTRCACGLHHACAASMSHCPLRGARFPELALPNIVRHARMPEPPCGLHMSSRCIASGALAASSSPGCMGSTVYTMVLASRGGGTSNAVQMRSAGFPMHSTILCSKSVPAVPPPPVGGMLRRRRAGRRRWLCWTRSTARAG